MQKYILILLFIIYPALAVAIFTKVSSTFWKILLILISIGSFYFLPFSFIVPIVIFIGIIIKEAASKITGGYSKYK
ncbi:MAG: hypothetical protein GF384_01310 [Elusimicrobia bacterium]|nr:hypothetical protein [Elusimicrobiota bacterium]